MFVTGAVIGAVCSVKSQEDRNNKVAADGRIDLAQLCAWRTLEWENDERKTRRSRSEGSRARYRERTPA